ncbi:MAG: DUF2953 domain-containing protein [Lachnospiraceae bacterium]|nr:DUF2953 domain-containing protein [Lachnospiraceae bacterium]
MISVILTILKILGLILLILLGILILVVCLVLFIPVRYRIEGDYQSSKATVSSRVTWLLHFVSARILMEYENAFSLHIAVRVLGIPIFDNKKKAAKKKKKESKEAGYNPEEPSPDGTDTEIQAASTDNSGNSESNNEESASWQRSDLEELELEGTKVRETKGEESEILESEILETEIEEAEIEEAEIKEVEIEESKNEADKKSLFEKLYIIFGKFMQFIENIQYTFHKLCDTIVKIRDNLNYYLDLLQKQSTTRAIDTCKTQLMRIAKSLSPQKFQVNLHLGFEDPAVLGEILAVWGMLYPFHQGRIDIVPEFGQTILEGDILLKGKISLFVYLKVALILFFDKNIKQLIKQIKRSI